MSEIVTDQYPYNRSPFNIPTDPKKLFYCSVHGKIFDIESVGSMVLWIGKRPYCRLCYLEKKSKSLVIPWSEFKIEKTETVSCRKDDLVKTVKLPKIVFVPHTNVDPIKPKEKPKVKIRVPFPFNLMIWILTLALYGVYLFGILFFVYFVYALIYGVLKCL